MKTGSLRWSGEVDLSAARTGQHQQIGDVFAFKSHLQVCFQPRGDPDASGSQETSGSWRNGQVDLQLLHPVESHVSVHSTLYPN